MTPPATTPLAAPPSQWPEIQACLRTAALWSIGAGAALLILSVFVLERAFFLSQWIFPTMYFLASTMNGAPRWLSAVGPFAWYYAGWFIIIWVLRHGSVASKFALVGCAALGLGSISFEKHLASQVDWTERRVDASRPGFQPRLLILAGTLRQVDGPKNAGRFEIRIAGPDFYQLSQTWPETWNYWGGRYTETARAGWDGWGGRGPRYRRWGSATSCGPRSGLNTGLQPVLMPGRSLWSGTNFTGATHEGQSTTYSKPENNFNFASRREEYRRLEPIGRWKIPREILFEDARRGKFLYEIRRIELLPVPDYAWFESSIEHRLKGRLEWEKRNASQHQPAPHQSPPKKLSTIPPNTPAPPPTTAPLTGPAPPK